MTSKISRAPWHDYHSRCIYMVTLTKSEGVPPFGEVIGDCDVPYGHPLYPRLRQSPIGHNIYKAICLIPDIEPSVRVLQYAIMPDHLHLLLFVQRPIVDPLGLAVARFKALANNLCGHSGVFADGFNDQILHHGRSLDTLVRYIRQNPWRLLVRRTNPDYFRRISKLTIDNEEWQAYGNPDLLANPFKEPVQVHRHDTEEEIQHKFALWRYTAANGGVLVSPFISRAERDARDEALQLGGRIITITNTPFGDRYKPVGSDFGLCVSGRLLIIAPTRSFPLSRAACLHLNYIAKLISR